MLNLEKPPGGTQTDLTRPLERIVEIVNKRGVMVLISDLLAPIDALEKNLASLGACGHEVIVFNILDPAELTFNFERANLFEDMESGRDLYVDPPLARKEYLKRLESHLSAVEAICQKLGMSYHRFTTDRPLEMALFDFVRSRSQRRKHIRRATPARHGS
jgi:uncharacterized protein (DUF58 family)